VHNDLPPGMPGNPARTRGGLLRYVAGILIFVGFVVFVEHYFNWRTLLAPWRDLSPAPLVLAVVVVFISYAVRALRLYDYFRGEMQGKFILCFKLFLQHNMLNNLLPMRSGELSFPWLMSRYFAVPPIRSIPALFWFRLLDLHTLLTVALAVVIGLPHKSIWSLLLPLWLAVPYVGFRLGGRLQRIFDSRAEGRLTGIASRMFASLPQSQRAFWWSWAWTLCNWVVKLAVFAWVLLLFIDAPVVAAWVGAIAGDLTSVLPIHGVAGAGTFEAGVVAGMLPFGVKAEAALPAAVNLHLFLLGTTVLGGLAAMLYSARRQRGGN
jgi:uncharacterized membrane protein YbhN (UPF0104 family)